MSERNQADEQARIDALFHDIFEADRRGAEVFEVLYQKYAAGHKVHTEGGIDAVLKTYESAAKFEVIQYIVKRCNRHRGVNDSPNDDEGSPK